MGNCSCKRHKDIFAYVDGITVELEHSYECKGWWPGQNEKRIQKVRDQIIAIKKLGEPNDESRTSNED